jgi:hypothetical protein
MGTDSEHDGDDRFGNQPKEKMDVSRREAFGRFAQYTAPVMLALLMSEQTASASPIAIIPGDGA